MKKTLDSKKIPAETPYCESCAYIREANNFQILFILEKIGDISPIFN